MNSDKTTELVGPDRRPNPHPFYGDNWERGLDPWHADAFPDELKRGALNHGVRRGGWFLLDRFNNQIRFVEDGSPV